MNREWILVLGASSELATHTVRRLAATPSRSFFLHYRTLSVGLETLLAELGPRAHPIQADLSNDTACDTLRQAALKICPQPEAILVAATPMVEVRRTKEIPPGDWHTQMAVQAIAPARILPPLLQSMQKGPAASQLVFVLSEVIRSTPKGMADYVTGKFATLGLMRALQAEFGSSYLKIHAIAPGMMETRFLGALPELALEAARSRSPNGQLLKVQDCAEKLAALVNAAAALKEDPIYLE